MRIFAVLLFGLIALSAHSATVTDLYRVSVAVENQNSDTRAAGLAEAYRKMLVRLSGTSASLNNETLSREAPRAETHITSMSYHRDESGALFMDVNFNPASLRTLFEMAQAPVWGTSRPSLLLLLAVETESGERQALIQTSEWGEWVAAAMKERGLPYIFPSWDLEDEIPLPLSRLWGQFEQDIRAMAERYPTDGYISGRLWANADSGWSFAGSLNHAGESVPVRVEGATPEAVVLVMASEAAESLSARYAVTAGGGAAANGFQIQVGGIDGFSSYRALQDYLSARVGIRDVRLMNADQDTVTLSLNLSGDWEQIWRVIELDQKLEKRPGDERLYWLP